MNQQQYKDKALELLDESNKWTAAAATVIVAKAQVYATLATIPDTNVVQQQDPWAGAPTTIQ